MENGSDYEVGKSGERGRRRRVGEAGKPKATRAPSGSTSSPPETERPKTPRRGGGAGCRVRRPESSRGQRRASGCQRPRDNSERKSDGCGRVAVARLAVGGAYSRCLRARRRWFGRGQAELASRDSCLPGAAVVRAVSSSCLVDLDGSWSWTQGWICAARRRTSPPRTHSARRVF